MKKILLIGMTSGIGGVEEYICNVVRNLSDDYSIDLLLFQQMNEKYSFLKCKVNRVVNVHSVKINPIASIKDVWKLFKYTKYDLVHLNECTAKLFIYVWPIMVRKNFKLLIHSHNGAKNINFLQKLLRKLQNKYAYSYLACSEEAARSMYPEINQSKIHVVKNGIDLEKYVYDEKKRKEIRSFNSMNDKFIFACIGRLEKQKNIIFAIRAFEKFCKKNEDAYLFIVGNGSEKEELQQYVGKEGLMERVIFFDFTDKVSELLNIVDCLLMPSLYEGMPFIAIEAQASGLPIIISTNVDDSVNMARNIYPLPISHPLDWTSQMKYIKEKKYDRYTESVFNIELLKKNGYDIDSSIHELSNIYENCIKGGSKQ